MCPCSKPQDGVLCAVTIDGQKPQPRSVSPQQWQRMWVAEDRDSYKRHLAASLFADILQKGQSQEEHAGEKQEKETEIRQGRSCQPTEWRRASLNPSVRRERLGTR